MTRTIDDTVYVRTRPGVVDLEPEQFIWRGRLYVVSHVLTHWRQRQSWWAHPAALAVHGTITSAADLAAAADRQIWRVRAAIGRAESGTYDLCLDGAVAPGAGIEAPSTWRLLAVDD